MQQHVQLHSPTQPGSTCSSPVQRRSLSRRYLHLHLQLALAIALTDLSIRPRPQLCPLTQQRVWLRLHARLPHRLQLAFAATRAAPSARAAPLTPAASLVVAAALAALLAHAASSSLAARSGSLTPPSPRTVCGTTETSPALRALLDALRMQGAAAVTCRIMNGSTLRAVHLHTNAYKCLVRGACDARKHTLPYCERDALLLP